jgi:serine/threonine protein kinase
MSAVIWKPGKREEAKVGNIERLKENNVRLDYNEPDHASVIRIQAIGDKWYGMNSTIRPPVGTIDESYSCQPALTAWTRRFKDTQVRFKRQDPSPFIAGRRLGGGGVGTVYETHLDGIALAMKRTYTRKLTERDLNEIGILERLSGTCHRHIVHFIGSYVHQQRSGYEIGILIAPVASCDLASYLHDMDALQFWLQNDGNVDRAEEIFERRDEVHSAIEMLSTFSSDYQPRDEPPNNFGGKLWALHLVSRKRLCRSFLCIAEAMAYLHRHQIRHKDFKPSQVLMSPTGLWLTDFGWSTDMSAYTNSATSNGDNTTFRYQAPERAAKQSCSRAEDIFTLGCTFLEMATRLTNTAAETISTWKSSTGDRWSFQADLMHYSAWLRPLRGRTQDPRTNLLAVMIERMLHRDAIERPTIEEVIESLSHRAFRYINRRYLFSSFFNQCCSSHEGRQSRSECSAT